MQWSIKTHFMWILGRIFFRMSVCVWLPHKWLQCAIFSNIDRCSNIIITILPATKELQKQWTCDCFCLWNAHRVYYLCKVLHVVWAAAKLLWKSKQPNKEIEELHRWSRKHMHTVKHLVVILYLPFKWLTAVPWLSSNYKAIDYTQ